MAKRDRAAHSSLNGQTSQQDSQPIPPTGIGDSPSDSVPVPTETQNAPADPETAKKRNRKKTEFLIQEKSPAFATTAVSGEVPTYFWIDKLDYGIHEDTGSALKWLQDNEKTGTFRIIAVKQIVTAKAVQHVKIEFA
jgi:hypothetical protein